MKSIMNDRTAKVVRVDSMSSVTNTDTARPDAGCARPNADGNFLN